MAALVYILATQPALNAPPWAIPAGTAGQILVSNGPDQTPSFQASSAVAQTTDTFIANWNGFTGAVSNTWSYVKTGNMVTLMPQGQATGTSNASSFATAAGALPLAIRPARTVTFENVTSTDAGNASGAGTVQFNADGSMTMSRTITSGVPDPNSWTGSGTKAAFNGYQKAFSYPLN